MINKYRHRVLVVHINDKIDMLDIRAMDRIREEIKRQLHEGVLLLPPWCDAIAVELDDYIVESGGEQE